MASDGDYEMTVFIYECISSFTAGILIGLFYFGGLWWTLRRLPISRGPLLWMTASFLVRAALSLLGFYFAAGGDWMRLFTCLPGFILVRTVSVMQAKKTVMGDPGR